MSPASTASWRVTALRLAPSADAQRDFPLAIDRAGQQQLADVDARDQQHDADRRQQQKERGPRRPDDRFLRRLGPERASACATNDDCAPAQPAADPPRRAAGGSLPDPTPPARR